ncbi:polymer-forming cytoskeletal protein [Nonomuraea rhodomycinica]|uniref:Polymer-forming cytoskeletal protein n=1 Tax=Nonomuraea rhodomycinica TaxID=1712872 RepID=A0A7Y6IZM7_9ACTN|nr:polymer-forming cytoskeletal protein [Nonomuraea rhodomycinica]NUW46853.1 polymer-forming cytoskeletal protein [Nonomuraea rhodomycinica]
MTALTYTVLTDPASLEASENNRTPSKGTVYLVITNNTKRPVNWSEIEVTVPVGTAVDALTPNTSGINPTGVYTDTTTNVQTPVAFGPNGTNSFHATASGRSDTFYVGDCMILTLADVTLTVGAGPVVLPVAETLVRASAPASPTYAAVAVVKTTPQPIPAPHSFRSDKEMLDTGDSLTLRWDGSDEFNYQISYPNGSSGTIAKPPTGASYSWSPPAAPTRATTYTLKATSRTTPAQEHFLTTTVQVRHPVLETLTVATLTATDITTATLSTATLTATTGIDTPWVQGTTKATKGQLTFTGTGVKVYDNTGGQGTVTAEKADLTGINTDWVQGKGTNDGWIGFRKEGLTVHRENGSNQGTVYADKAELNGINTKWVQGKATTDGWIEFPAAGVNVFEGAGNRQWGTVAAGKADLNDLITRRAQVKDRLTLQGGLTVDSVLETQDGPPRLIVHGQLDAEGEVNAKRKVDVGGDLSVNGDVRPMKNLTVAGLVTATDLTIEDKLTTVDAKRKLVVHGPAVFNGKVEANREMVIRGPAESIMHIDAEKVLVRTDLQVVHGLLYSNIAKTSVPKQNP